MTKWIAKAKGLKTALSNRQGETLVEGVVSMLVFAIFMLAVTTMILASLRLTAESTKTANANQDAVNAALLGSRTKEVNLTIFSDDLKVTIPVLLTDPDAPQSFRPKEATP